MFDLENHPNFSLEEQDREIHYYIIAFIQNIVESLRICAGNIFIREVPSHPADLFIADRKVVVCVVQSTFSYSMQICH